MKYRLNELFRNMNELSKSLMNDVMGWNNCKSELKKKKKKKKKKGIAKF